MIGLPSVVQVPRTMASRAIGAIPSADGDGPMIRLHNSTHCHFLQLHAPGEQHSKLALGLCCFQVVAFTPLSGNFPVTSKLLLLNLRRRTHVPPPLVHFSSALLVLLILSTVFFSRSTSQRKLQRGGDDGGKQACPSVKSRLEPWLPLGEIHTESCLII